MRFLFPSSATNSICCVLVLVMVFAFCIQAPMWLPRSPMGDQVLGFALLQPYTVHSWQAYVPPGDGPLAYASSA